VDFLNNDTSPAAEAVLIDLYRRMSSVEKARRLSEACRAVDQLARARIRHQYGEISDAEMKLRLGATRIPRDLMVRVFGWDPEVHGY
jgi:hypothetical protein